MKYYVMADGLIVSSEDEVEGGILLGEGDDFKERLETICRHGHEDGVLIVGPVRDAHMYHEGGSVTATLTSRFPEDTPVEALKRWCEFFKITYVGDE